MPTAFLDTVRANCAVSDARDNGVFSLCTLFLRLRNLYKWEYGLEPWQEEDPPVLLDWIAQREEAWEELAGQDYRQLPLAGRRLDPFDAAAVNRLLADRQPDLFYGSGYGRSLKAVFFVGLIVERRTVAGVPVLVIGTEMARELASPFAMVQDGVVVCRRQSYRYALWDWIQEGYSTGKRALRYALDQYGLIDADGAIAGEQLQDAFDTIVDRELEAVVHHEIGELAPMPLDHDRFAALVRAFPASAVELVTRAVRDLLADTHPDGMLGHIVAQEKKSSLGFYAATLDGMRRHLAGELVAACNRFFDDEDWQALDRQRHRSRQEFLALAERLAELADRLQDEPKERVQAAIERQILAPLELLTST